jgi:CBS domain containing-hemolysin-like protein
VANFFLILLLIALNAFFVASEIVLIAIRRTKVEEWVKQGNPQARLLAYALDHIDHFISATQLGVTIVSLLLGWIGEPILAGELAGLFQFLPGGVAGPLAHTLSIILTFLIITVVSVVFGELVPKSIALQKTEFVSLVVIAPLWAFSSLLQPFIRVLSTMANGVLRLLRLRPASEVKPVYSEEELKLIIDQVRASGAIPKEEADLVRNVFRLKSIPIRDIMMPRTDIVAFESMMNFKTFLAAKEKDTHSRFPIYNRTIDDIIGFIHVKDVYRVHHQTDEGTRLKDTSFMRKIINVPETKKALEVLLDMRHKHIHVAVVNDEYGGTSGIVTLEDIIESLVGDIQDEFDQPIKAVHRHIDGSYLIDGRADIEVLRTRFRIPVRGHGYTTVGGFVFGLLGHAPKVGDRVQVGSTIFEVTMISGKRIQTVRLRKELLT